MTKRGARKRRFLWLELFLFRTLDRAIIGSVATFPLKPGDLLEGKYQIERVLGAGGMGVVVAARHVTLGRRVAIKFMLPQVAADPANAQRFAREARAAVSLRSEHAGRVLDVGNKDGAPYMVMELLDGQDLDDLLRAKGRIPAPTAVMYLLQACEAIAEAHSLGIIHRDLKPKNIFVTRDARNQPCVKVLDFGLAKMRDHGEHQVALTQSQMAFGSPQYMSPEQMRSTKDVDARTDVWALGVTLYELLTGQTPFTGATMPEIHAAVLKDRPRPPSELVPHLPKGLEQIVLRCLEKDAGRRYSSVIELSNALAPFSGSGLRAGAGTMADVPFDDAQTIPAAAKARTDEVKTVAAWDSGDRRATRSRYLGVAALSALVAVIGFGLFVLAATVSSHRAMSAPGTDPTFVEATPPDRATAAAASTSPPVPPAFASSAPSGVSTSTPSAASSAARPPRRTSAPPPPSTRGDRPATTPPKPPLMETP